MLYSVILPDISQFKPGQIRPQQEILRQILDRWNPPLKVENVLFTHDPDWNLRIMSIQCAHDQNHPVWQVTGVLFGWAQATPILMGIAL
jgi:hypothetical protein